VRKRKWKKGRKRGEKVQNFINSPITKRKKREKKGGGGGSKLEMPCGKSCEGEKRGVGTAPYFGRPKKERRKKPSDWPIQSVKTKKEKKFKLQDFLLARKGEKEGGIEKK